MTKREWFQRASNLVVAGRPVCVVKVGGKRVVIAVDFQYSEGEDWLSIVYSGYTNFYKEDEHLPDILVQIIPEAQ